jgi:hypothetical protein
MFISWIYATLKLFLLDVINIFNRIPSARRLLPERSRSFKTDITKIQNYCCVVEFDTTYF